MDNIKNIMQQTDWTLLAQQKLLLIAACISEPKLEGLLAFIDALQDAAERDGFPVVFLTDGEDA